MIIYKLPECTPVSSLPEGAAIALGNFDGVHKGHQKLFDCANEIKRSGNASCSVAWSFVSLAKPVVSAPYITDTNTKLKLFAEFGLNYAVFENFENVCDMTAEEFVCDYLIKKLHIRNAVCGFNFKFGKNRSADADALSSLLAEHNANCSIIPAVLNDGQIISSSLIRELIENGKAEEAHELLGHPFSVCFPVIHGKELGRTIGIPTINQVFPKGHIVPKQGIYACSCFVGGDIYLAVSNIGVRPTVEDNGNVNCETHIINYNGDLYDKEIEVHFYCQLREEMKFPSVDALRRQIKIDISATLEYFSEKYGE